MNMTRQEQLDAVVRNYGEWDDRFKYVFMLDGRIKFTNNLEVASLPVFTRQEVEQRKAELQNKPSWDDAPEWAKWLAQDSDGSWHFYEEKPENDHEEFILSDCNLACAHKKGEVIGDWRDTPEKRPEPEVTEEVSAFKMLETRTNKDWKPEIGSWVLSSGGSELFYVGIGASGNHIFELDDGGVTWLDSLSGFKPAKSDRDKWIDAALHIEAELPENYQPHELMEALYDAGLAKIPDDQN